MQSKRRLVASTVTTGSCNGSDISRMPFFQTTKTLAERLCSCAFAEARRDSHWETHSHAHGRYYVLGILKSSSDKLRSGI